MTCSRNCAASGSTVWTARSMRAYRGCGASLAMTRKIQRASRQSGERATSSAAMTGIRARFFLQFYIFPLVTILAVTWLAEALIANALDEMTDENMRATIAV